VFKHEVPDGDGVSQAAHLEQARASAEALGLTWFEGNTDYGVDPADPPECFEFIWETFRTLSHTRRTGFGLEAIAWADIKAWCDLHDIQLTYFELHAIYMLDQRWRKVMGEAHARSSRTHAGGE